VLGQLGTPFGYLTFGHKQTCCSISISIRKDVDLSRQAQDCRTKTAVWFTKTRLGQERIRAGQPNARYAHRDSYRAQAPACAVRAQRVNASAQHTVAKTSMVFGSCARHLGVLNFGCAGISQVRCRLITGRRTKWMDRCASNERTHSLSLSLSLSHSLSLSLSLVATTFPQLLVFDDSFSE